jgi:glycogen synthase
MINKGDKIYYYNINIRETGEVKYKKNEYEVIAAKDESMFGRIMVIDDYTYSRIQTKKEKHAIHSILNSIKCHEWKWATTPDELNCRVYSTCSDENKMKAKIQKEIQKYSENKGYKYKTYIEKSRELKGE